MSVVVALPTFGVAADVLTSAGTLGMGSAISALESVWLYVALRTVPAWAFRRMAGPRSSAQDHDRARSTGVQSC